jgi:hypothetical protein
VLYFLCAVPPALRSQAVLQLLKQRLIGRASVLHQLLQYGATVAYLSVECIGHVSLRSIHSCSAVLTNTIVPAVAAAFGWAGVLH